MLRPVLAAACALLVPAAAGAQDLPQPPVAESAADLAYGYCPLFLAGQFSLTAPELVRHGFGQEIQTQQHPQHGEIRTVTAKRGDGELAFGGVAGRTCSVVVAGSGRAAALARLRETMSFMGLPFEPAAYPAAKVEGVTVETFKAPVENQFLYIQLIQAAAPAPMISAQLFVMEK